MDINGILITIDNEISNLQQARALLTGSSGPAGSSAPAGKQRGRPKGSVSKSGKAPAKVASKTPKRTMSEEGKQRISAAQKARWAAQKKSVKAAGKKASSTKLARAEKRHRQATKLLEPVMNFDRVRELNFLEK